MNNTLTPQKTQAPNIEKIDFCPGWVKVTRQCGNIAYVQAPCSDPFCKVCQKIKAERAINKWRPEVETWSNPKFVTLTIKSGSDLQKQYDICMSSFSRLMHMSLDVTGRNWPKLKAESIAFEINHLSDLIVSDKITLKTANNRLKRLRKNLDRLGNRLKSIQKNNLNRLNNVSPGNPKGLSYADLLRQGVISRKYVKNRSTPRFRDLISRGVRTWETTKSHDNWHFHLHVLGEMDYLPWSFLVVSWRKATHGNGSIVDIRSVKSSKTKSIQSAMLETFKYTVKPGQVYSMTDVDKGEARKVFFNKQRIKPLGHVNLGDSGPSLCPDCGKIQGKGDGQCQHINTEFGYSLWPYDAIENSYMVKFSESGYCVIAEIDGQWVDIPLNLIPQTDAFHSGGLFGKSEIKITKKIHPS